jgi:hypothetical protein
MQSSACSCDKLPDPYLRWGVLSGPWLVPIRLRILFVIDGRISTADDPGCFGLGLVLNTLCDDSFSWWVRFKVDVFRRDDGSRMMCPDEFLLDAGPPCYAFSPRRNFRFTDSDFSFEDYDQIWFFGDYPANDPGDINDPKYSPLTDAELKLLAEWMDRGGGVFATGDHYNLGASMCSRIPRVRTMRKWTVEQGVPPEFGDFRNQTLQEATGYIDEWEGDSLPQTIEPVYKPIVTSPVALPMLPPSLLSVPSGVITKFPDHMHEGEVIDDDAVELDQPLNIPGYNGVEYPIKWLTTLPHEAPGNAPGKNFPGRRPRPHVVAYGRTTQRIGPAVDPGSTATLERAAAFVGPDLSWVQGKRFALIGAYDGDDVGIGRVVVDSTWHHWFSYNLHGFRDENPFVYEGMQAYYRNVGLWLTTPAQRQSLLTAAVWGIVASDPMGFPREPIRSLWEVGERALQIIGRTTSQSTLFELVKTFFKYGGEELFSVPRDVQPSEPCYSCLPLDLALRAIVGGVATALLGPASDYHMARRGERRQLDPDAIVRRAKEGAEQGYRALVTTMQSASTLAAEIAARLADDFQKLPPRSIQIPVDLLGVRVIGERLQLTDPTDPALVDGHFTLTARLKVDGSVIADNVIDGIDIPPFEPRGAFVGLSHVLYEGVVQSGESLVIEIVSGAVGREPVNRERVRFSETLEGEPSSWIGVHTPSPRHPWRLWYRVEQAEGCQESR